MASIVKLLFGTGINTVEKPQEYIEETNFEKGFAEHYEAHLRERVEEYENERVNALKVARRRLFFTLPLLPLMFFLMLF